MHPIHDWRGSREDNIFDEWKIWEDIKYSRYYHKEGLTYFIPYDLGKFCV